MKKIRMWFYKQALKDNSIVELIERQRRTESIAYNLWVDSLAKKGFPRNENGTCMDCWQLYDYFYKADNRSIYIQHSDRKSVKEKF